MPALAGMAPISGDGLPPTSTTAEIDPAFSRSRADLASRSKGSTLSPSALNSAAAVAAEADPAGPKLTGRPDKLGHAADIGPGEEVNLLRRQPGDQLELFG